MRQLYNYHTHTKRCRHAYREDEEYVLKAIEGGYKDLGFSDHIFFPGIKHLGMRGEFKELEEYIYSIQNLKEKYKDKINIYLGFEAEYMEKYDDYYKDLYIKYGFDYLILGQHCVYTNDNVPKFYKRKRGSIENIEQYVRDLILGMSRGYFSYVAHPDYYIGGFYSLKDGKYIKYAKMICEASLKYDVPLEINLAGIEYQKLVFDNEDYICSYPYYGFWKIVGEYGCKVVIGVDAHMPDDLLNFDYSYAFELIERYKLNYIKDFKITNFTFK